MTAVAMMLMMITESLRNNHYHQNEKITRRKNSLHPHPHRGLLTHPHQALTINLKEKELPRKHNSMICDN